MILSLLQQGIPPVVLGGLLCGWLLQLQRFGLFLRFFVGLPGTLAHELAHFLAAFVMRANPGALRLFPRAGEDGTYTLGSVTFEAHLFSAGWIALAPLYVLPLLAAVLLHWTYGRGVLAQGLGGYVLSTLIASAIPSKTDWKVALRYPLGTLIMVALLVLFVLHFTQKG